MNKNSVLTIIFLLILVGAGILYFFSGKLNMGMPDLSNNSSLENSSASTTQVSGIDNSTSLQVTTDEDSFDTNTQALPDSEYERVLVTAPKGSVSVLLADSDLKQELGLSFRESLDENSGMLFVFEEEGVYQFWMKDMNFPLDIIWLDRQKKVVGVINKISPESYPATVAPENKIKYVLELPAGKAETYGIATGTILKF